MFYVNSAFFDFVIQCPGVRITSRFWWGERDKVFRDRITIYFLLGRTSDSDVYSVNYSSYFKWNHISWNGFQFRARMMYWLTRLVINAFVREERKRIRSRIFRIELETLSKLFLRMTITMIQRRDIVFQKFIESSTGERERTTGKSSTTRKERGRKAPPPNGKREESTTTTQEEESTAHKEEEGRETATFAHKRGWRSPFGLCCLHLLCVGGAAFPLPFFGMVLMSSLLLLGVWWSLSSPPWVVLPSSPASGGAAFSSWVVAASSSLLLGGAAFLLLSIQYGALRCGAAF